MKRTILTGAIILASLGGQQAMAAGCSPTNRLSADQIYALLAPDAAPVVYACGSRPTPPSGVERWNEYLVGGLLAGDNYSGGVYDYKMGPGSTVDPPGKVGTYEIIGDPTDLNVDTIVYNYGAGGTYRYYISSLTPVTVDPPPPGQYNFCNPSAAQGNPTYTIQVSTSPTTCGFPP